MCWSDAICHMVCNCFKMLQTTSNNINSWLCPTIQALLLVPASGKSSFRIMKIHCSKEMWLFWTSPRNSRSPFWCAVALQSTPSAFGLDRVENFEFGLVFSSFFSSISPLPNMPLSWHSTRKKWGWSWAKLQRQATLRLETYALRHYDFNQWMWFHSPSNICPYLLSFTVLTLFWEALNKFRR